MLRNALWYAVLVIGLVAAVMYLPGYLNRAQVPPDFEDISGLTPMTGVWLEGPPYVVGDTVAFRTGEKASDVGFAFVAALPGNQVSLLGGVLQVDGKPASNWRPCGQYHGMPRVGPLTIPAGHLYVVSTQHQHDSLTLGPIGPDRLLGKVRE